MNITVDYREEASGLIDLLKTENISIEVKKVLYGDYIINNSITIERKTAKDFLISIIDARLFRQLLNLKKYCTNPVLLIEGNPYKTDLGFENVAIKGALISAQAIWYMPVIFSRSKEDTKDIFSIFFLASSCLGGHIISFVIKNKNMIIKILTRYYQIC